MNEKLEKLNEYINEKLGMELQKKRETTYAADEIESLETMEQRTNGRFKLTEDDMRVIQELKKYKDHKCLYAIDSKQPVLGQGFIIVSDDLEYVGFVRTV